MTTVPSNLIPTRITQLPEYAGSSTAGYLPYVIDGITYKVQFSNIAAVGAVPSSRTITGGSGLTGGGDLTTDRVISIAAGGVGFGQLADSGVVAGTYGDSANIPVLTVDQKGRVTVASTTAINLAGYVPTSRSILAGTGLSGGGTLAADRTISLTLSSATPQPGGVPSAGSGTVAAREDHVHPAVDLSDTTETSGVLPMSRGGTGGSLSPVAGALVYSDGSKFDLTTLGSTGQALFGNGAGAPTWHTISTSLSGLTMGFVGANYTLSGTLGITSGGTGATTLSGARIALLPSYAGNAGKALAVNGSATDIEWVALPGTGTVTSVNVSGGATGLTATGGPVTTSGTITLAGTLAIASGGTGATTNTAARTNLGATTIGGNFFTLANPSAITFPRINADNTVSALDAASFRTAIGAGGGSGTVTSVAFSTGTTGLTVTGSPITSSGTITLSGTLAVANGGTGVTTSTGSGSNVLSTSPVLTTPNLGTPSAATLTNATGLPIVNGTTGTLTVARGGTGATTLTGVVKGNGTSAFTAGTVALATEVSGTLPVANGGTGATTLTANNVILGNGTSAVQVVAPGASGNVLTSNGTTWTSATPAPSGPTLTAVASGSLSNGSTVVINADGTVSVAGILPQAVGTPTVASFSGASSDVSATYDASTGRVVIAYRDVANAGQGVAVVGLVSGTDITFGFNSVFETGSTTLISATYDASTQRVVIAYRDVGNSSFGTAAVGTVSGDTISFGTPVVFESANTDAISATYDASTQRVVIAYRDVGNSNFGTAIVGTVSGTSISFGTAVVFASGSTDTISATYDSGQQKVLIAYRNASGSNFGTAIVGTVSGTSISFGTAVVFRSVNTINISATYDNGQQKIVIASRQFGTTFSGTAIIGTVSGTSISFGTAVSFGGATTDLMSATYDSSAQKVVIAYQAGGFNSDGFLVVGTVSGTSVTFDTPVQFEPGFTQAISATYDSVQQRVVIAYRDTGNSSFCTAVVFRNAAANLTAENFIGFSNAAYTNGQTATIQVVGSVEDAQTGLTPGQSYYVQTDGTLSTTPGSPSVFAGTAVAATKIIVKG